MHPAGNGGSRASDVLASFAQEFGKNKSPIEDQGDQLPAVNEIMAFGSGEISVNKTTVLQAFDVDGKQTPPVFDNTQTSADNLIEEESYFDWLGLPINDQFLFNGAFGDSLWEMELVGSIMTIPVT